MSSSVGALKVTVQADATPTAQGMAQIVNVVEGSARRINTAAAGASNSISKIGSAGRTIGRVKGAEDAAASIEKIGHSSVASRRELLVLAHELSQGQLKRAAGSFMVLGEQMDFMGKLMSPVGLAVGAVTAIVGGLAVAAYHGMEAHTAFNKAIVLTGNYAGVTEGRLITLTQNVADSAHVTVGTAREITEGLVSTGRIGGAALEHVAMAAGVMASLTGQKGEEVVKDFAKMSDGVLKWALEADKQYHFMTGALFDHVKSLEDAGDKEQAMIVVADALTSSKKRLGEQLGITTGAFKDFKSQISQTFDAIGALLGRMPTLEERIQGVQAALANAPKQGGLLEQGVQRGAQRGGLNEQLSLLTMQQRSQQDAADYQSFTKTQAEETVKFKEEWSKRMQIHHESVSQMNKDIEEAQRIGKGAGASQADIDAEVKRIRKEYTHKDAGAGGIQRAETQGLTQPLERQISAEEKLLAYRERVLAQYHKADLISDQSYYDTRATVITAAQGRIAQLYDLEIAAVQQQAGKLTDARARIEANNKVEDLRAAKQAALLQIDEATAQNNFDLAQSTEKYRDEVTKLTAELDKLRHTQSNSAGAEFDRAHSQIRKQATVSGDTDTLRTLSDARAASVAQADMNTLKERATLIENALKQAEAQTQLQVQTGQKTEVQGWIEIGDKQKASADQLQVIADRMKAIAEGSGLPELADQAAQFQLQVDQIKASSDQLGRTVNETFATSFSSSLLAVQNRTKSVKQAFLDMANAIEQSILKIVDNDIAQMLFNNGNGASGGGGSSGMGLFGKLVGLAMTAFGGGGGGDFGSEAAGASSSSTPDDLISGYSGRASGGSVLPNGMYQVNERGPELLTYANKTFLMMGDKGGQVTPVSGSGRQSVFNMNIAVPAGTSRATAQQQAREIMVQANIAMARNS
jgi:phage-related minor tail protein